MSIDDKESPGVHDAAIVNNDGVDEKKGNAADRADMYRMGKTQEMRVRPSNTLPFFPLSFVDMTSRRETFASCRSLAFL